MITAKGLSKRWSLELELAEVLGNEGLKGQSKRDRLIEIVDSRTYAVNLATLEIPEGRRLVVRAEDRQRPTVVLGQELAEVALAALARCHTPQAGVGHPALFRDQTPAGR